MRVGPASAGSEPGPACYGNGGVDATVTDAHVVLGYLNPEAIAGGTKRIYAERAHDAVARIAAPLGLSTHDTAFGIYSVVNSNMRRAVRTVSVERGRDPRSFSLFAFGGAGGLHAAALAAEVEMPEVVIPIVPGLFSSLGLLFSELAVTRVVAHRVPLSPPSLLELLRLGAELADSAIDELRRAHQGPGAPGVDLFASLRYIGQSSTLFLHLDSPSADDAEAIVASTRLAAAFHREHRRVHGQAAENEPVELVGLRARATWKTPKLKFSEIAGAGKATEPILRNPSTRKLYFGPAVGWKTAPIISRDEVGTAPTSGPLVIEEPEATVVVPPGWSCALHPTGAVLLTPDAPTTA